MTEEKKDKRIRILFLCISLILNAILYNLFLLPLNLVAGGTSGVATITHYTYGFDPALIIFLLSMGCAIISFMYLGVKTTMASMAACIIYPLLVKATANISNLIYIDPSDPFLMVIFAGVINGICNGLMYKSGYNNGGFPVISQILFEKKQISVTQSSLVINLIIVIIGSFFFGATNALYAIIFLYINGIVLDKVLLGISNNKAFYIITQEEEKIREYIINNLHHTITTFEVKGAFLETKRRVILTVIPSREYYRVTTEIKEIDKDAFFVVTDAYQVEGAK